MSEDIEGLDFEAAYYANVQKIAEDKHQAAIWWRAFVANHHLAGALDALDHQHRARLAAEREKWEAEVETLRGEWDEAVADLRRSLADTERVANDWKAEAKDRQREVVRQVEAKVTAEARVQRLEAGLGGLLTALDRNNSINDLLAGEIAAANAALLPEETTK